jgi:hypothetical protein
MDEPDVIPRREAIAGVTLLGALGIALVGTIVYRIHYAVPIKATPRPQGSWTWANVAETPAPTTAVEDVPSAVAGLPEEPLAAAIELPPVEPIPTIEDSSASIPAASTTVAPPPATVVEPAPPVRPIFVAPGAR